MNNETPLGLIALGGALPLSLAAMLKQEGTPFHCLGIEGVTDNALRAYPHDFVPFLKIGKILSALKRAGCKRLVFAGHMSRPDFSKMRFDMRTLRYLPLLLFTRTRGDNAVVKKVSSAFEAAGFEVVSINDIAPSLAAAQGHLGRHQVSEAVRADIVLGLEALHAVGEHDIGQALVVDCGRVIAVEAVEGTDEMLRRVQALRGTERYPAQQRSGVLVKAAKPQQKLRDDMPVVGISTVRAAVAAGLAAVAVESGRVVMTNLAGMISFADENNLAVIGVAKTGDDV